ncbi:MAG: Beta-ketoacyl synthase domain-containing protein [uncultured Sulfurovum sp.]|uniref:Beta-ketoacyl synthase domain-containing protein n=1 Tax=uncultured Sulfurovum sp. TaxID=269237 RepID=A0A6S6TCB2_9BACT|nr:MAG: Beta-ketoacyl synthase domain-containing protein [uncultured Sulfurovum sp.]
MTINLEILDAAYVYAEEAVVLDNIKELVPKMVVRRRLTRAGKIAIYLANQVSFSLGKVVYGSSFGELEATANILNSINMKEGISPTQFQNSVYNTAISYLSMLTKNQEEVMTLSSGDDTSLNVLKSGAIKAMDGDTLLLLVTETLNIDKIEEVNKCVEFLECGVALKVRFTRDEATLVITESREDIKIPLSVELMFNMARCFRKEQPNIIEVKL